MLFLFRSAPEVEKRIHSKLFRNFLEEPGYKRAGLHYCNSIAILTLTCTFFSTELKHINPWLRDRPPCGNKWKSKGWSHEDKQFSLLAFPKLRKKVIHYDCGLPFSKGGISLLPFLLFGGVMNSWVGKAGLSTQIKETKRSVKRQYQKNRKKETAKLWQGSKRH